MEEEIDGEEAGAAEEEELGRGNNELNCSSTGVNIISTSPCSSSSMGKERGGGGGRWATGTEALLLLLLGLGAFWMTSTIGVRPGAASSQLGFPGVWSS